MTIHIEKITKGRFYKQNERGITELCYGVSNNENLHQDWCWEHVPEVYGKLILNKLKENNIEVATKFGTKGITLKALLDSWFVGIETGDLSKYNEYNKYYYEIPFDDIINRISELDEWSTVYVSDLEQYLPEDEVECYLENETTK